MRLKLKNIIAVIKDQMPIKRFFINFFVTRNAWGLFHKNSHIASYSGAPKIAYSSSVSSNKAANKMNQKYPENTYRAYKCLWCDGYHIGKTKKKEYHGNQ